MNKLWTPLIIILLLAIGGWLLFTNQLSLTKPENDQIKTDQAQPSLTLNNLEKVEGSANENQKIFQISGKNFTFSLNEIRVKQGDLVKIIFTSSEGFHDWTLDEFEAKTLQVSAGNSSEVEFRADKQGTFEFYCSIGNHRQMGMVGKFIVE